MPELPGGPREEPVGSLAEEALKLLAVLRARAEDGAGGRRGSLLGSLAGVVRDTSPEVRSHLTAAATSLVHAAAAALDTPVPDEPRRPPDPADEPEEGL